MCCGAGRLASAKDWSEDDDGTEPVKVQHVHHLSWRSVGATEAGGLPTVRDWSEDDEVLEPVRL